MTLEAPSLIQKNVSLKDKNWWKVGGAAEYFASPRNIEELKSVWHWGWANKLPIHVLSSGSNILIQEGKVRGLTIAINNLKGIESIDKKNIITVTCLAGTPKSEIAKIFLQNRLAPAVFLTGIPGDMGSGVVMNAGIGESRVPREFCEIVKSIDVLRIDPLTGAFQIRNFESSSIRWEYRHSWDWQPGIIVRVTVQWSFEPDLKVVQDVREQTRKRVSTQPLDLPNCGSVFRNPIGHKSAQLIDSCGLKGFRVGGAMVSLKHANFIVNDLGSTSGDIAKIIEHVKKTVREKTGIELQTEIVYFGEWPQQDRLKN